MPRKKKEVTEEVKEEQVSSPVVNESMSPEAHKKVRATFVQRKGEPDFAKKLDEVYEAGYYITPHAKHAEALYKAGFELKANFGYKALGEWKIWAFDCSLSDAEETIKKLKEE